MRKFSFHRAISVCLSGALLCACGATATTTSVSAPQSTATDSAAATETATPEPAPDPIAEMMQQMTMKEKIGQMFMVRPDSLDFTLSQDQINDAHAAGVTELSEDMKLNLAEYPIGGIGIFGKNIADADAMTKLISDFQSTAKITMLVGVDEEGGKIARIANNPNFEVPQYESAMAVGDTGDAANAKEMGKTIGSYLLPLGFNLDFAPDADVNTNPDNPVIGNRAFSDDPETAAAMVSAAIEGFHEAGIACTIKHFPGHGDTAEDSHYGCATTEKTWDEMRSCEMLPFRAGIEAGTDVIMAAHITTPNVTTDGLPASLSKEMITDKLRGELGYNGVVICDSLAMEAVSDFYTPAEAACMAIEAGEDILLMPNGLREAFDGVESAVADGTITEARIDESVYRILTLKQNRGLI